MIFQGGLGNIFGQYFKAILFRRNHTISYCSSRQAPSLAVLFNSIPHSIIGRICPICIISPNQVWCSSEFDLILLSLSSFLACCLSGSSQQQLVSYLVTPVVIFLTGILVVAFRVQTILECALLSVVATRPSICHVNLSF